MSKEYPKYSPYAKGDQDECWKRYSKRIKKMLDSGEKFEYPLDKMGYGLYPQYEYYRALLTDISPSKFLNLAIPKSHINHCSLDYLLDAFEYREPKLNPVYFNIDYHKDKCRVIGHEGRHRAEIAQDLGIERIPITLRFSGEDTLLIKRNDREDVDYDSANETYDELREISKKEKEGTYYDTLMKLKDKWTYPNKCYIHNLYPERIEGFAEIREERKKFRKSYELD